MNNFSLSGPIWTGTVVSGAEWRSNEPSTKDDDPGSSDWKGYGWRCKVRIHGLDTSDQSKLPDNQLPWVPISLATNAGSGKGDSMSHAICPGDTVIGVMIPGDDIQPPYPIIIGSFQTAQNLSDLDRQQTAGAGYDPFTEVLDNLVAAPLESPSGKVRSLPIGPSIQKDQTEAQEDNLSIPCPKSNMNATGSVSKVQGLINNVKSFKNDVNKTTGSWINNINNTNAAIQKEIDKQAEWLRGQISNMIKKIMEWVIKKVNAAGAVAAIVLPLNTRFAIREAENVLVEALYCIFNKLLNALTGLLADWLRNLVDAYVRVPLCVIENLLSNLIGQLVAAIKGLLNGLAGAITGLIGSVTGFINEILDFISNLLELFNCDVEDECEQDREWNILDAASATGFGFTIDVSSIIDSAKSVAASFESSFSGLTGDLFNPFTQFDLNASLAAAYSSCSGAPLVCGPPSVSFWGGGAIVPALGTPVVSSSGGIISVNITNQGFGYQNTPFVSFVDDCGLGSGATGYAITGPSGTVTGVVITSPGTGYTGSPTGAIGAGGAIYAPSGSVLITTPTIVPIKSLAIVGVGTSAITIPSFSSVSPGILGFAPAGSLVTLSGFASTSMVLTPVTSTGISTLINFTSSLPFTGSTSLASTGALGIVPSSLLSPGFSTIVSTNVTFTVPLSSSKVQGPFPSLGSSYPVILYLCDIKIQNPGLGYKDTDEIVIIPDNGAKAELVVGRFGEITAINIIDGGSGFTDLPKIKIKSTTGYNAKLLPVLCSSKIGDNLDDLFGGIGGGLGADEIDPDKIIKVIDCVGKVTIV